MSRIASTLGDFQDYYKNYKGKALYMLFILEFFKLLFMLTFENETFTTAVKVDHMSMINHLKKNCSIKLSLFELNTLVQVALLMLDFEVTQYLSPNKQRLQDHGLLIVFPVNINK